MKNAIRGAIAANLKQHMTSRSTAVTKAQLAMLSGLPQSTITRILNGTIDASTDAVAALAKALGIPSSALLDDDHEHAARAQQFREQMLSLPLEAREKISRFMDGLAVHSDVRHQHAVGDVSATV